MQSWRFWKKTELSDVKKSLRTARATARELNGVLAEKLADIESLTARVEELEEIERQLEVEVEKLQSALILTEQQVRIQAHTIENYIETRKSENLALHAGQQMVLNGGKHVPDQPTVDHP